MDPDFVPIRIPTQKNPFDTDPDKRTPIRSLSGLVRIISRVALSPGLVLGDDPDEADNVGVAQVGHQLALPLKVLPRLTVGARLERFDGHQGRHAAHNAAQLAPVHLAKHPVTHLLDEAHRADGKLACSHLGFHVRT